MTAISYEDIDNMHFDILKEIGNIGAGNATTALSMLLNEKVNMSVPSVKLLEFKDLAEVVGGAENLVVGILLNIEGDLSGMIMFITKRNSAKILVNLIMHCVEDVNSEFTEMELSALNEIGNIISGAYLSALSTLTNMTIVSTVPNICIDMAGAILSVPAIEFGKMGDKALLIQSQFVEDVTKVDGYFILIPELDSYEKIMKSLGV